MAKISEDTLVKVLAELRRSEAHYESEIRKAETSERNARESLARATERGDAESVEWWEYSVNHWGKEADYHRAKLSSVRDLYHTVRASEF